MAIGDAMVAPAGLQNQMYGQPSRVPGYSQGLGQAPGQMALPPEPMPIGRPTAVVGGPAYFTPAGYQAPPQPTEAFMPTDVRPDPIGQQFMRQMESPMGQQFQAQYEATRAPIRKAEMARRVKKQAAQDARFQKMMDRIAELEGQLAQPSPMPELEPYVPGGPFPGIPDFIRDLDFSGLPNFDIDYDDIMRQDNDRETITEAIERKGLPTGRGFIPEAIREIIERREEPRLMPMPVEEPEPAPVMPRISMPKLPDFQSPVVPTPELRPEPIYTPPPMVPNIPKIPTIPNIDFSNLPKFDLPTTGGRPMIPSFGNINLR